jgi:hypothetical protein
MRFRCKLCSRKVSQERNQDGPNYCPQCHGLFYVPPPEQMPPWILGVLGFLTANWQLTCRQ